MPRNPKDNADSPKNYKMKDKSKKKKKAQESGSDSDSSSDYQPGDEVEDMNTLEMQKFIQKIFPSKSGRERMKQLEKIDQMMDKQEKKKGKKGKNKKAKKNTKHRKKRRKIKHIEEETIEQSEDETSDSEYKPEEDEDLINELNHHNIDLIRLITPTTDEDRLKLILKNASGFLYYVSVMGITGQKSADLNELEKSVKFIKKFTNLPVVPGFGIKNSTDVSNICKVADGAVVGSSIIKIIEENLTNKEKMLSEINKFTKDLKNGTRV